MVRFVFSLAQKLRQCPENVGKVTCLSRINEWVNVPRAYDNGVCWDFSREASRLASQIFIRLICEATIAK